jgi:hypothetical protein
MKQFNKLLDQMALALLRLLIKATSWQVPKSISILIKLPPSMGPESWFQIRSKKHMKAERSKVRNWTCLKEEKVEI